MLTVAVLTVVMLTVVMLTVVMLTVVMMSRQKLLITAAAVSQYLSIRILLFQETVE